MDKKKTYKWHMIYYIVYGIFLLTAAIVSFEDRNIEMFIIFLFGALISVGATVFCIRKIKIES